MIRRERIEAHLRPVEIEALTEWCRGALIPLERWPYQPELRCFVDLATRRLMAMMRRTGRARSDQAALVLAAGRLGLNPDSTRRRWARRRRAVLVTKCPTSDQAAA